MEFFLNVKLPTSFKADIASKKALQMSVARMHGDGWTLRSVDLSKGVARFVRVSNDDDRAYEPDVGEQHISVRLTGKEDLDELSRWVASKYGEQYTLTSVDPISKTAFFKVLSPEADRCRWSVAALFSQKPWEVTVDNRPGGGFVVSLPPSYRPSRYDKQLDELASTTIGKPGWSFVGDPTSGKGEFIPGSPPTFPALIPFQDVPRSNLWSRIYLGEQLGTRDSPETKPLFTDLDSNPHTLINGTTNSGKSVLVFALITGALIGGWDLVIIDPEKEGIDFEVLRPWITPGNLATTLHTSVAALERVLDEMQRRTNIIKSNLKKKWTELPVGTFPPIMVVIEEAASLLTLEPISKGLSKESEAYLTLVENNAMRGSIQDMIGRLLRKARFTGISLVIVSQTSRAASGLPPAMRELTSGRILTGVSPTKSQRDTALKDPDAVPTVPPWIANDPLASRGVGVFEFDGSPPGIFKSVFIEISKEPGEDKVVLADILAQNGVLTRSELNSQH
ncbi:FtsK/SpoIIIE domain-containing protein [Ferrimicrobium acidiphilum]|uniref:FtsK/SpoIIIE domain-containing protein n=1 Tax=Ferrimicrobium acidiphilum TaxID=121039 RepID=UPI0023F38E34|nr:FtsK/SpoIIIE domain-containing protein [Ferrimicrobium acidiphilum]